MKRLLDHDEETGITRYFHADGDEHTIETVQDIEPILDLNKAQQNEGFNKSSDMWHAATIPAVVQLEWLTKHGVDLMNENHMPAVKKLLNSSDYRHLRRNEFKL